jgi:hypothetical protein
MNDKSIDIKSLQEHVVESIASVLYSESFPSCELTPKGILALVDQIASYHEEGTELFPHILITTSLGGLLESVPFVQKIVVREADLHTSEFNKALKLCAPLAIDGWVIFIELNISDRKIIFGLLSSELSETSPSLHRQLLGDLSQENTNVPFLYISNVGQRTVLIEGDKKQIAISLSLKTVQDISSGAVSDLSNHIAKNTIAEIKETIISYFEKLFDISLKNCHGTLIGVVEDSLENIENLKKVLNDGVYFSNPIDLSLLIENSENEKSREASSLVRIYSSILQNMLNFDGITVLSTSGKIIGYHCFIEQESSLGNSGGARSRAFEAMVRSKAFICCLYKSQDGHEKFWSKNE